MTGGALVAGLAIALAGCEQRTPAPAPSPPPVGSAIALPDPLTLDWKNLVYDLGALGVVRTTAGRADLGFIEDDEGALHATQDPQSVADGAGALVVEAPSYLDLDGDGHDEAVIPYELVTLADVPPGFGVFVFTLRGGAPIQLAMIPTPRKRGFTIAGRALVIGSARWRWDPAARRLTSTAR